MFPGIQHSRQHSGGLQFRAVTLAVVKAERESIKAVTLHGHGEAGGGVHATG